MKRSPLSTSFRVVAIIMLGLGATTIVLPLLWTILSSLKTRSEILEVPALLLPRRPQWVNYSKVVRIIPFGTAYFNSLLTGAVATLAVLFTSSIGGYAFAKLRFRGRDGLFLVFLSTLMVPFFLGSIPLYVLIAWFGWVDTYYALIVPFIVNPFGVFFMRQFILGLPGDFMDSARMDGCTEFGIYHRIVIPLVRPALSALAIFIFVFAWNDLYWPLLVIQSSKMFTIPIALSNLQTKSAFSYELLFAGLVLSILPVIVVFLLGQRAIVEGVVMTGLKA